MIKKSGYIEFKSQKEIIDDRREQTQREYEVLQKEIQSLLKENYSIANSALLKAN